MKLLIITQSIDKKNPVLGFFHRWVLEFSKHFEKVTIICLEKGEYSFPDNIKVLSLGKEISNNQFSIINKVKYIWKFYKYIWSERNQYDVVFVHMNPIYVILGGLFWKLQHKKISLWYTHKQVDLKLKVAEKLVDIIFSASKESFRLPSPKLNIMGDGIDVDFFKPSSIAFTGPFTILSVGRISKTKNQGLMLDAFKIAKEKGFDFVLKFVGGAITDDDKKFESSLRQKVKIYNLEKDIIFEGAIRQDQVMAYYNNASLFLNLSNTGSMDKAVLEAMASGLKILTSNEAFKSVLPESSFVDNDVSYIADKMIVLSKAEVDASQREFVVKNHELSSLITRLSKLLANEKE